MRSSISLRAVASIAGATALLAFSPLAAAQTPPPAAEPAPAPGEHVVVVEGEHAGGEHEHHHHNEYFFGLNGTFLAGYESETSSWRGKVGGGGFFEFVVVPNKLEIELGFHVLKPINTSAIEVPIDVLFKKPYHVEPWFHPYWGVGPTLIPISDVDPASQSRKTTFQGGVATVIGTYLWPSDHVGFSVELDNNLLFAPFAYEIGATAGIVFGW